MVKGEMLKVNFRTLVDPIVEMFEENDDSMIGYDDIGIHSAIANDWAKDLATETYLKICEVFDLEPENFFVKVCEEPEKVGAEAEGEPEEGEPEVGAEEGEAEEETEEESEGQREGHW